MDLRTVWEDFGHHVLNASPAEARGSNVETQSLIRNGYAKGEEKPTVSHYNKHHGESVEFSRSKC